MSNPYDPYLDPYAAYNSSLNPSTTPPSTSTYTPYESFLDPYYSYEPFLDPYNVAPLVPPAPDGPEPPPQPEPVTPVLPITAGTYGQQLTEVGLLLGLGIITGQLATQLSELLGTEINNEVLITKFFSFWTPGSDYALGQDYLEFSTGREGFDVIIGYDPGQTSLSSPVQIDYTFLASFGADNEPARYVLGDWRTPYYVDNNPLSDGLTDYMFITTLALLNNPNNPPVNSPLINRLQLYGSIDDYYFVPTNISLDLSPLLGSPLVITVQGTEIYYKTGQVVADLIAVVPFRNDVDPYLISQWIDFAGYAPPALADFSGQVSENYLEVESPLVQLGNEGIDLGTATALALDGGLYVAGATSSVLGQPRGNSDNFIARYNQDGSLDWVQQFGSTEFDIITDIASDALGNVYATGWTRGDVVNGVGLAPGVQDNWVAKFDANGNQIWVEQFTIDGYLDRSMSLALDETNGRIYLTGHSNTDGLVDDTAQSGIVPNGNVVTWIASFDATTGAENYRNVFEVAQTSGARGRIDEGFGVAVDNSGNVFAIGWAGESAYDVYHTKFDASGTELWSKSFGTGSNTTQSYAWDVASDGTNAYILGWTQDTLDTFRVQTNPSSTSPLVAKNGYQGGPFDAFVAAYDGSGNELWTWHVGGDGDDGTYLGKIVVGGDYVYATGYTDDFIGTLGGSNAGDYDAWIGKFNKTTGATEWIQQIGSSQLDYATGISVNESGDVFVTGFTEGSLGRANGGASDVWTAKLNSNGLLEDFNGLANSSVTALSDPTAYTPTDSWGWG